MQGKCLKLEVTPINDSFKQENTAPTLAELEEGLRDNLIPAINSVHMIAQMIETQTLGPVDLGPYKSYIDALKDCAIVQDNYTKDLAAYIKQNQ